MKKVKQVVIKPYYATDEEDSFKQRWFADILNNHHLNYLKLSEMLHVSKQTIPNWVKGMTPIPYMAVVTICYVLKLKDNPDEVFDKMKGDKT